MALSLEEFKASDEARHRSPVSCEGHVNIQPGLPQGKQVESALGVLNCDLE